MRAKLPVYYCLPLATKEEKEPNNMNKKNLHVGK